MPHSYGFRARTRSKYTKAFRTNGMPSLSRYLTTFKRGDHVDIKVDSAIHKGMPFHIYHGRTGVVFNVTKNAVGVELKKTIGNREVAKRFHVRIEHVRKSRCNEDFLARVKENDAIRHEAKLRGEKVVTKRQPILPQGELRIASTEVRTLAPLKFVEQY
eukprot:GDKH01020262.1.p1 GENE.GDKH01020262.1~~GDKH01020262.1.p1  ORF type:complete len:159 (-),score=26.17 GDKH01020262.1:64-540(-)